MEKVIIINDYNKSRKQKINRYDRFYYGNEFCPYLIADISVINKNLDFLKKFNKPISFLTSYIDNSVLKKMESIIRHIVKKKYIDEIVINDLGLYNFCQRELPNLKIVAGRFISKIFLYGAFRNMKIERLEVQGNYFFWPFFKKQNNNIKYSLYSPYVVIQGTRYCSFVGLKNKKINPGIQKCHKECLKIGKVKLHNSFIDNEIILLGNVQLLKAPKIDLKNIDKNIDRIIFQEY